MKSSRRALAALAFSLLACGDEPEGPPPSVPVPEAAAPRDVAVLEVASMGEIRIELLADVAPLTAAHFAALAEQGFYDGVTFHRVVPGFMIQSGDPNTRDRDPRNDGNGVPGHAVSDERPAVSHVRGMVSLANRGVPSSASTQFFILLGDSRHLDGHYALFGRVVSGMDVADRIGTVERDVYGRHGPEDRPVENVVVTRVRIERAKSGPSSQDRTRPPSIGGRRVQGDDFAPGTYSQIRQLGQQHGLVLPRDMPRE